MTSTATPVQPTLATRLRSVVVGVRGDLDVSRHMFLSGPAYVLRDPLTFRTHSLEPADYSVFASISADRTLDETFRALVARDVLASDDEHRFYAFVLDLHRQGLLSLPIDDSDAVFARAERREAASRRSLLTSIFFFRVPLVNPDRVLTSLAPLCKLAFSRFTFAAWVVLMLCAVVAGALRSHDLASPFLSAVSGNNLILLWGTLVALKALHEIGHAAACKAFGGHVPEIGATVIMLTPCAYVDASDSWRFSRRTHRIIVALGGMYFESIAGAISMFVWALTPPSAINTVAYQAILLSTVVTVGFNMNPLMKYDGYYILSDLLGIPNLRSRCENQVRQLAVRACGGPSDSHEPFSPGLAVFGIALFAYRVSLVLSVCVVIATRFYFIGIALAVAYLVMSVLGVTSRLARFASRADISFVQRWRPLVSAALLVVVAFAASAIIPVTTPVSAWGVVERERQYPVRAPEPSLLALLSVRPGDSIESNSVLASLQSDDVQSALDEATAARAAARVELDIARRHSPASAGPYEARSAAATSLVDHYMRKVEALDVRATESAVVLAVSQRPVGSFMNAGDEIALLGSGGWRARVMVEESSLSSADLRVGKRVACRSPLDPSVEIGGTIVSIEPVGGRSVAQEPSLAAPLGGPVAVPDLQHEAPAAMFRVVIKMGDNEALRHGARVRVILADASEPLGARAWDTFRRTLMRIRLAQ